MIRSPLKTDSDATAFGVGHDLGLITRGDKYAWATFSPCGRYRYAIARLFGDYYNADRWKLDSRPLLVCALHNPSTATHDVTDPTLKKLCHYARRDRYGGVLVGNAFAWRTTDPRELRDAARAGEDIVGPHNLEVVQRLLNGPLLATPVGGWGAPKWKDLRHGIQTLETLGVRWRCWHVTKDGHPGHPLYLSNDAPLVPLFPPRQSA